MDGLPSVLALSPILVQGAGRAYCRKVVCKPESTRFLLCPSPTGRRRINNHIISSIHSNAAAFDALGGATEEAD